MAFRRRYKKRARRPYKKTWRQMKRKYNRKNIVSAYNPIRSSHLCKFKYYEFAVPMVVSAIGVHTPRLFRANSINDPDQSGTGHQPRGHDTMATLYRHYTVVGSKITVTWTMNTNSTVDCRVGIALRGTSTTEDIYSYMEHGNVVHGVIPGGNSDKLTLSKTFSTKRFFRRSPKGDSTLKALFGANPSEEAFFHLFGQSLSGEDTTDYYVDVKLSYICILSEPLELGIS